MAKDFYVYLKNAKVVDRLAIAGHKLNKVISNYTKFRKISDSFMAGDRSSINDLGIFPVKFLIEIILDKGK